MAKYSKFIAAAVGVVIMGLSLFAGIGDGTEIFGLDGTKITAIIISILTAIGVERAPKNTD